MVSSKDEAKGILLIRLSCSQHPSPTWLSVEGNTGILCLHGEEAGNEFLFKFFIPARESLLGPKEEPVCSESQPLSRLRGVSSQDTG